MGWQVIYHYGADEAAARRHFDGESLSTDRMLAIELLTDAGARDDVEVLGATEAHRDWQPQASNWRVAYDYGDDETAAVWVFEASVAAKPFDRADYIYLFSPTNERLAVFDVLQSVRDSRREAPTETI